MDSKKGQIIADHIVEQLLFSNKMGRVVENIVVDKSLEGDFVAWCKVQAKIDEEKTDFSFTPTHFKSHPLQFRDLRGTQLGRDYGDISYVQVLTKPEVV